MSNGNSASSGGIGVSGLLLVAFIVLKLTGHITWSWIWVLSPAWMPLTAVLVVALVAVLIAIVVGMFEGPPKGRSVTGREPGKVG